MENKTITYDDVKEWERIVNEPKRQEAINNFHHSRQEKRQRRILIDAIMYASVGAVAGLFGVFCLANPVLVVSIAALCGICSAFCLGRWFENGKCCGWY